MAFTDDHTVGDIFVNLRTHLIEAAKSNQDVYYSGDTHWGPKGHQLAGQAIGKNLRP